MANTATALTKITSPLFPKKEITPITVTIDTPDSDLTVFAAVTGKKIVVVKQSIVVPTVATITLKSGSNSREGWPLGANSGVRDSLNGAWHFITGAGEALVIRSSAALTSSVLEFMVIVVD